MMSIRMESESLEFKSEIVPDICKEVVAFANTRGGEIWIGVADDGTVVGVSDPDEVMLRINNMVRDSIKPDVTMFVRYEIRTLDGKGIVAVTVQKGTGQPYYLAAKGLKPGGVYVRNGASADPSTDTAIRRMIKETDGDRFEDMRSLAQELTFATAEAEFHKRDVAFGPAQQQTLGLISADGVYSNLGYLLSDQCPGMVKAATFSGLDKNVFQDRREFSGSLFRQTEELYAYLELRNQTKATFEWLYRTDTRDYPEEALREAMLNSIVHRNYSYSARTLVRVYADRIEFVSIGGLLEGVTVDDIMLGLSVCRNPKLAAVFYRLDLIEAYGTGMQKIMNAYRGCKRQPAVEVTNNAFKITLPNRNASAENSVTSGPEQTILQYLQNHDVITRSEVDAILDVSQTTSSRILKRMLQAGLLVQTGSGRKTKYRRS